MMNCDLVFDILTRGPFPAGQSSDAAVERHLSACHDCRQLAEALRPAVELFHETIEPDEALRLPGYHGTLRTADVRGLPAVLEAVVPRLGPQRAIRHSSWRLSSANPGVWRFTAAALLLAALCGLLWGVGSSQQTSPLIAGYDRDTDGPLVHPVRYQPNEAGQQLLLSLNLTAKCLQLSAASLSAPVIDHNGHILVSGSESGSSFVCCQHCHEADDRVPAEVVIVAAINRSTCNACHVR